MSMGGSSLENIANANKEIADGKKKFIDNEAWLANMIERVGKI